MLARDFIIGSPEAADIQWIGWSEYREAILRESIEQFARWRSEGFKAVKSKRKSLNELAKSSQ